MKRKLSPRSTSSPSCNYEKHIKINKKIKKENKNKNKQSSSSETPVRRSSIFRGVTRHRLTGRFEAHLWDRISWNNNKKKKGKQIYLGAYNNEEAAARTYDLASLKHSGPETTLNFAADTYRKDLEEMDKMSNKEYIAFLRRKCSGFSRGVSVYRGVARHHHNGRWEARIGRLDGNKYMYLGTFATQEEAARAYDLAAIEQRGANAVTNFNITNYSTNKNSSPTQQHDHDGSTQGQVTILKDEPNDQNNIKPKIQNLDFEDEHPWSVSMELGYNQLLFPDNGFEANIDSIFTNKNDCATSNSSVDEFWSLDFGN